MNRFTFAIYGKDQAYARAATCYRTQQDAQAKLNQLLELLADAGFVISGHVVLA